MDLNTQIQRLNDPIIRKVQTYSLNDYKNNYEMLT